MEKLHLDDLLKRESSREPEPLPEGFASNVLRRAREVRSSAIRHWKLLSLGSVLALSLAAASSYFLARLSGNRAEQATSPPKLELFRPEAGEFRVAPNR